jgi:hypothetical protein
VLFTSTFTELINLRSDRLLLELELLRELLSELLERRLLLRSRCFLCRLNSPLIYTWTYHEMMIASRIDACDFDTSIASPGNCFAYTNSKKLPMTLSTTAATDIIWFGSY